MLINRTRHMAPEGDPTGNGGGSDGTPATPPTTPAQGNGTHAPAAIDTAAIATEIRNSIFAELRRSGALGGKEKPAPEKPAPHTPPPPAQTVDVEAVLDRRETFARVMNKYGVSDGAYARAKAAFNADNPPDIASWVASYAGDMGWSTASNSPSPSTPAGPSAAPSAAPSPAPAVAPTLTQPAGSPPARVVTDDTPLWQLSVADRAALAKRIGPFEFKKRLVKELSESGQRFSLRR